MEGGDAPLSPQEHSGQTSLVQVQQPDLRDEATANQEQAMDVDKDDVTIGNAGETRRNAAEDSSCCPFGFKKRFRRGKGPDVRIGPPRLCGAVEIALRNSPDRGTVHIFEPVISTSFDSLGEAYEFYNLYSWEVGFGIRYGTNYSNGEGYRSSQDIVCQMEGIDRRTENDSSRCGCKAMIRLHRYDDHGWFVAGHRADHNHPFSDNCGEKMQWNSHKKIDEATKDIVRYLRENNVSLSKVHCILGSMHGSDNSLPFTKKSLRTICQQIARDQRDDDIKKTMDLFRAKNAADGDFDFKFDLSPEGRIRHMIWTSGHCRRQYACFGDVVVFDTTYTTNLYKMPFGLFVGVNNHFQTVIYTGILMCEETVEGFNWAFEEFVSLMGGKAPLTMLTDQARAMEVAIAETLPETTHRWCKWHVFRKAKEGLGPIFSKKTGFKDAFNAVVNEILTVDEFETAWKALIDEFDLADNSFMIRTYEAREKWAQPYFKDKYCARMTSTQRVESANHMLKTYVPRNSSMNKFVAQYNKLLKDRNETEDFEEHKNKQCNMKECGGWPIERHARKIYTRAVMKLFKEQISRGESFDPPRELEKGTVYELEHAYAHNRLVWAKSIFKVRVEEKQRFFCECGLYGHFGIVCGHVIRLMIHLGLKEIPDYHIMKRWTKGARDLVFMGSDPCSVTDQISLPKSFRHNIMYVSALEMVKLGGAGDAQYNIVMKHISAAKKELKESDTEAMPLYYSSGCDNDDAVKSSSRVSQLPGLADTGAITSEGVVMKEPLVKRGRGRPKENRYKSFMDGVAKKAVSKDKSVSASSHPGISKQSTFYRLCKKPGHNSSTCWLNPNAPCRKMNSHNIAQKTRRTAAAYANNWVTILRHARFRLLTNIM